MKSFVDSYGFDGVDIDWEYPGFEEHNGTPDDKENFTLLMQEIRDSLDFYDPSLLLTAAVGASADRMDDVDWDSIAEILDLINVMSYDFFGSWDEETNHNAPLYAPNSGDPSFNLDSTITRLIDFYNVSIGDYANMKKIFKKYNFDIIVHLCANAYVGESVIDPKKYYKFLNLYHLN